MKTPVFLFFFGGGVEVTHTSPCNIRHMFEAHQKRRKWLHMHLFNSRKLHCDGRWTRCAVVCLLCTTNLTPHHIFFWEIIHRSHTCVISDICLKPIWSWEDGNDWILLCTFWTRGRCIVMEDEQGALRYVVVHWQQVRYNRLISMRQWIELVIPFDFILNRLWNRNRKCRLYPNLGQSRPQKFFSTRTLVLLARQSSSTAASLGPSKIIYALHLIGLIEESRFYMKRRRS